MRAAQSRGLVFSGLLCYKRNEQHREWCARERGGRYGRERPAECRCGGRCISSDEFGYLSAYLFQRGDEK